MVKAQKEQGIGLGVHAEFCLGVQLSQDGGLGGFEHAIEAAQHREGQDDLAVFGLLVVAAQEVGNGPDEGGEVGFSHDGARAGRRAARRGRKRMTTADSGRVVRRS